MGDSVEVRCPECLRALRYAAPAFPCSCGTPVAPPVIPGATATPLTHRNGADEWVTVHCPACARATDWPHPEVGCACGAVLRVPVREAGGSDGSAGSGGGTGTVRGALPGAQEPVGTGTAVGLDAVVERDEQGPGGTGAARAEGRRPLVPESPETAPDLDRPDDLDTRGEAAAVRHPGPEALSPFVRRHPSPLPPPRPAAARPGPEAARAPFRPVTIRTTRDAVAASAGYLRWLGFRDVVQPEERSASAVDLRGPGLVAQVDPSTRPTGLRAVECLWLNGLSSAALSVSFSLAGYTPEAHERAEGLGIPLFVLDLTGTPQPVNGPAAELLATGAP
ncbi:hypothetical protein ABZ135_17510 [Streptomyces sp. NPDC006339]|uniref:hypothetical protein n=1 Tax=Streptomyces sp. NPDC006339 TaxID=3156755 RepID=UPI0033A5D8E7